MKSPIMWLDRKMDNLTSYMANREGIKFIATLTGEECVQVLTYSCMKVINGKEWHCGHSNKDQVIVWWYSNGREAVSGAGRISWEEFIYAYTGNRKWLMSAGILTGEIQ